MRELGIKDVAEQTGIAAGTIRVWEQRYGFPQPARTASGYRIYTPGDVEALRRVAAHRKAGLSVPAAIGRAAQARDAGSEPSIYAAVAATDHGARPQVLRKSTLAAVSRAIEHETLAQSSAPVLFGAFQREAFYREAEPRYRRIARSADAATVFADFPAVAGRVGAPLEVPIAPDDQLGNEWAVIVDAPGYCACLLAWELPGDQSGGAGGHDRRFESIWTVDPRAVRRAAEVAAGLVARSSPEHGARLHHLLADRPLALHEPAASLTALTNRIVAYVEAAG